MKIHFLGTCAGTEPMPTRKHSSTAFEVNDALYFFDAGEGCSYTAHNMGLDLLKTRAVFISHPHLDHVGGLCNLLWTIRKLRYHYKNKTKFDRIDINIPTPETFEARSRDWLSLTQSWFTTASGSPPCVRLWQHSLTRPRKPLPVRSV